MCLIIKKNLFYLSNVFHIFYNLLYNWRKLFCFTCWDHQIAKIPEEEDICNLYVYISWDIWGEKTAYTPQMKCPNLVFNSSFVYRIANLFSFFKNVLSEYLIFRVNIIRPNDTTFILARAKVSIKDILDYPQNKLHYIVPVNSVISCFLDVNFGQLSLWVRLSCNVDIVEAFKKQCGIISRRDTLVPSIEKNVVAPKVSDKKKNLMSKDSNDQYIQSTLDSSNFAYIICLINRFKQNLSFNLLEKLFY